MTIASCATGHLTAEAAAAPSPPRTFDGVICFGGEDWWYHNRGHYDMQMMRCLSARMPILYVNSIGMRMPKPTEGAMFLRRMARKLRSIRRGAVTVADDLTVFSPLAPPGAAGSAFSRRWLARSVRSAARRAGITHPLIWGVCPTAADVVDALDPAGLVYQRTDRYEAFPGVDAARIVELDRRLKARADLTVFCSSLLFDSESRDCRHACLVDHGVDFARFAAAITKGATTLPDDIASLPRPRVGFIGAIDAHTFDPALFIRAARRIAAAQFVLVGPCSLPDRWCTLDNVTILGQRPYDDVAAYMAACDVLIMPWRESDWTEACNPIKLKEYLASGRPVVSTDFAELRSYDGLVRRARGAADFAEAILAALREPHDPRPGRARVRGESWSAKMATIIDELVARGLAPYTDGAPPPRPSRATGGRHRRWPEAEARPPSDRPMTKPLQKDGIERHRAPRRGSAASASIPHTES